jgi:hypothetical protein
VLALEAALATAMIALTLELPYFGQAKAAYALGLLSPLGVSFALGAETADEALGRLGGEPARVAGRALLTTAGVVFALAFAG